MLQSCSLAGSAKASCRTLQIAEPKALNLEKDFPAKPCNLGFLRKCPQNQAIGVTKLRRKCPQNQAKEGQNSGKLCQLLTAMLLKSITIQLQCASRCFCTSVDFSHLEVVYAPPICMTYTSHLHRDSRYLCRSIVIRVVWTLPKSDEKTK